MGTHRRLFAVWFVSANHVWVSGTTATGEAGGIVGIGDAYARQNRR